MLYGVTSKNFFFLDTYFGVIEPTERVKEPVILVAFYGEVKKRPIHM